MMYPSPRTILAYLASHGPSVVQLEALRLFDLPMPDRFPAYARGSKEALLRRLACNRKKSTSARLDALKQLLFSEPERIDPAVAKLIGLHDAQQVASVPPEHEPPLDTEQVEDDDGH